MTEAMFAQGPTGRAMSTDGHEELFALLFETLEEVPLPVLADCLLAMVTVLHRRTVDEDPIVHDTAELVESMTSYLVGRMHNLIDAEVVEVAMAEPTGPTMPCGAFGFDHPSGRRRECILAAGHMERNNGIHTDGEEEWA